MEDIIKDFKMTKQSNGYWLMLCKGYFEDGLYKFFAVESKKKPTLENIEKFKKEIITIINDGKKVA